MADPTDEPRLSHLDDEGRAHMVDVGEKPITARLARARGVVRMERRTRERLLAGDTPKGDVFATVRIAGIQAAKRTSELIPLCHPLPLDAVSVTLEPEGEDLIAIEATARCTGRTGVEMEAMTAVSVAALTLYDMLKAIDRGMRIESIELVEKRGGKSGTYLR